MGRGGCIDMHCARDCRSTPGRQGRVRDTRDWKHFVREGRVQGPFGAGGDARRPHPPDAGDVRYAVRSGSVGWSGPSKDIIRPTASSVSASSLTRTVPLTEAGPDRSWSASPISFSGGSVFYGANTSGSTPRRGSHVRPVVDDRCASSMICCAWQFPPSQIVVHACAYTLVHGSRSLPSHLALSLFSPSHENAVTLVAPTVRTCAASTSRQGSAIQPH